MTVRSELGEAGAVVGRLIATAGPAVDAVAAIVAERDVDFVLAAARGTSDHAAIYAQYVLGERNGLAVGLAAPSLASLYGRGPRLDRALVVGISQSGRSPDVVGVLETSPGCRHRRDHQRPGFTLAAAASSVIPLDAGPEISVAATKTYVAELTVVAMLSEALRQAGMTAGAGGERDSATGVAELPATLDRLVADDSEVAAVAGRWTALQRCVVLGRGYQYATAREWALKLKEIAGVASDPYSAADFEHGPIAGVAPGSPVLAVATAGPALAGMAELLGRLRGLAPSSSSSQTTRSSGASAAMRSRPQPAPRSGFHRSRHRCSANCSPTTSPWRRDGTPRPHPISAR